MSSQYLYIAEVADLAGMLIIKIVDFVPDENQSKLKIEGHKATVKLLYQKIFDNQYISLNFGMPGIDDVATNSKSVLLKKLAEYKSPLGNDLYNLNLDLALSIVGGGEGEVSFYKGERVAKKQKKQIQKTIEDKLNLDQKIESIKDQIISDARELDLAWKHELRRYGLENLEWKKRDNNKVRNSIFGSILGVKKSYKDELDLRIENYSRLINQLPNTVQITCNSHPKTEIDALLEPVIHIDDALRIEQQESKIKKQSSCTSIVDLKFELGGKIVQFSSDEYIGNKFKSKTAEGRCSNCQRAHRFTFDPLEFLFFRPNYMYGGNQGVLNQFFYFRFEELISYGSI
jgi:hypothetical protein